MMFRIGQRVRRTGVALVGDVREGAIGEVMGVRAPGEIHVKWDAHGVAHYDQGDGRLEELVATSPSAELAGGKPSRTDRCPPPDVEPEQTMAELREKLARAESALADVRALYADVHRENVDLERRLEGDPANLSRPSDLNGDLDTARAHLANALLDVRLRDQQIERLKAQLRGRR